MTQDLRLRGNTLPLQGIRGLDPGSFIAAPFAARLSGGFGAAILQIEKPHGGDELSDRPPFEGFSGIDDGPAGAVGLGSCI